MVTPVQSLPETQDNYYRDFAQATASVLQDMLEGYDDNVRPSRQRLEYLIDWAQGRRWAKEEN